MLVMVRLEGVEREQELAALDLGARPLQAFIRVAIPQALPGMIAAAMIAFALSMDEFIMTFLVTGSQTTLPLYIYGSLRFGVSPQLNALASLMLVASLALILVGMLVAFGKQRRHDRAVPIQATTGANK